MAPNWFASLRQDGRYALRSLSCRPWRPLAAVGMLGLAIGIATAMFTLVDALVLRPVPFADPDRLARLYVRDGRDNPRGISSAVFRAWRESPAFAAVEAAMGTSALVGYEGGEVTRRVARVTPGVFELLGGVRPVRGRLFDPDEGRPGSDDRILISEDVWLSLYGADPSVVGRTITLDGKPAVVVGILPSHFRFPEWNTVIWWASSFDAPNNRPTVYVRFAPTMSRADALDLASMAAREAGAFDGWRVHAWAVAAQLDDYYAKAVPMLSGGVVLLFIVLCANVASLLLAGLTSRAREFGTRTALGASRARLIRHALLEGVMLGTVGVVAGAALGWSLVSAARSVLPHAAFVHSLNTLDIDARALGVASIAGLVATLGAGLLPAVIGTRVDVRALLQGASGATPTGRARAATRALLVCQVALSCTLVFGSTLLGRSFVNLVNQDRGLDVRNVLKARVHFPSASFGTPEARMLGARAVEEAARALPGVTAVAWSYGTPPGGGVTFSGDWTSDLSGARPVTTQVYFFVVDADFLHLYRVPLLRGRSFVSSDGLTTVMVSERFARMLWPGQDPVGRRFTYDNAQFNVVGLVRDIRYPSLDSTIDSPQVYVPFRGDSAVAMLSLRCADACQDPPLVRQRLSAALPAGSIADVMSPEDEYVSEFVRPRAAAVLASAFAVTALIAAATGLFSLFSQNVARRRREFGIRTALGATPGHVRRLVWTDGLVVTVLGIAAGALASVLMTRVLSSLLFHVATTDPMSWAIVAIALTATIAAAAWHPTRSAVRAAPVALLRDE